MCLLVHELKAVHNEVKEPCMNVQNKECPHTVIASSECISIAIGLPQTYILLNMKWPMGLLVQAGPCSCSVVLLHEQVTALFFNESKRSARLDRNVKPRLHRFLVAHIHMTVQSAPAC